MLKEVLRNGLVYMLPELEHCFCYTQQCQEDFSTETYLLPYCHTN